MSATTVKLLQTASEIVGGDEALASRLGISQRLLARFMADKRELPDAVLLRAVDIVLADSLSGFSSTSQFALRSSQAQT